MAKKYGPRTHEVEWVPVRNPRVHLIGSLVYGVGRNLARDGVVGTLQQSYATRGGIRQGYYIIEYPDGETRAYNVIRQVENLAHTPKERLTAYRIGHPKQRWAWKNGECIRIDS